MSPDCESVMPFIFPLPPSIPKSWYSESSEKATRNVFFPSINRFCNCSAKLGSFIVPTVISSHTLTVKSFPNVQSKGQSKWHANNWASAMSLPHTFYGTRLQHDCWNKAFPRKQSKCSSVTQVLARQGFTCI